MKKKTWSGPCAIAVLHSLGIKNARWTYHKVKKRNTYRDTIRRNGYGLRSRNSYFDIVHKSVTVDELRERLRKFQDPHRSILVYLVQVHAHVLLVSRSGEVLVDTDPQAPKDNRLVEKLDAIIWTEKCPLRKKIR